MSEEQAKVTERYDGQGQEYAKAKGIDRESIEAKLEGMNLTATILIGATKEGDAFTYLEGTLQDFVTLLLVLAKEQPELVSIYLAAMVQLASESAASMVGVGPGRDREKGEEVASAPAIMATAKF